MSRPAATPPGKLPFFIRWIDPIVERHERWVTEMRDTPEYYRHLLRFATTGDPASRTWLAEALSRYEYWPASRIWGIYTIILVLVGFFLLAAGPIGCGIWVLLALLIYPLNRLDRWRRRRAAWRALAEGKPLIHSKLEVTMPSGGSRIFQSYWTSDHPGGRVELDHPIELLDAVNDADEFWQWLMPAPHDSGGRVKYLNVHFDVGLVRRLPNGEREIVRGGVVYFSYDPWSGRIDTGGYE